MFFNPKLPLWMVEAGHEVYPNGKAHSYFCVETNKQTEILIIKNSPLHCALQKTHVLVDISSIIR